MATDVVTKFYYLEHGKTAPKNSEYKGIVNTASLIGFSDYTKRDASKKLSDAAQEVKEQLTSFFDYTSKRFGAKMTYSSSGWLDTTSKINQFKTEIASNFNKDGDICWAPIISLQDYLTSTQMKLFNEQDYAAILDKVLPVWFTKVGLDYDNMIYWMDYHVNTDNPHIHLTFLEKNKTKTYGKFAMKDIKQFKNLLWKEIFAKQRYLEEVGKSAAVGFKEKDALKKETLKISSQAFKHCSDKQFNDALKSLYQQMPATGRLQYNSSHIIPYREQLDQLVDRLLALPDVKAKYNAFISSVQTFDDVRSKNLGTEYRSMLSQEDSKLRVQLANMILKEYKSVNEKFWSNRLEMGGDEATSQDGNLGENDNLKFGTTGKSSIVENSDDRFPVIKPRADAHEDNEKIEHSEKSSPFEKAASGKVHLPIAASLVSGDGIKQIYIRIPKTQNYMYVDKCCCTLIGEKSQFRVATVDRNQCFKIYDKQGQYIGDYTVAKLEEYFSDGKKYLKSLEEQMKQKEQWLARRRAWSNQHNWGASGKKIQRASFAWMHKVENDVEQAREEFLRGKEMTI